VNEVESEIQELKEVITRERYFDLAEYKYQTINKIMEHTREMYQASEKKLFGDSMMGWSALSGFHAKRAGENMLRFDASSFSLKSAYNSLFVPPDMKLMISDRINQIQNRVRKMNCERSLETDVNYVQGTFDRQMGIENDYIHFFAPGDPIFDSIVNNALGSYKGTCAAFACKAPINWMGLVFTWTICPDETILFEHGLTSHVIDQYRGFMPAEQFQYAVGLKTDEVYSSAEVLKVYNYLISSEKIDRKKFQHLGSRSGRTANMEKFMNMFPEEKWSNVVEYGYNVASSEIKKVIGLKMRKRLYLLKGELLKNTGAKKATNAYFGDGKNYASNQYEIIYECFSKAKIKMDSVCYVRMINEG
jgi:ATP-dependent helicase HepA